MLQERDMYKEKLSQQINSSIELRSIDANSGVNSSKSKNKSKKYLAAMGSVNSGSKTSTSDKMHAQNVFSKG